MKNLLFIFGLLFVCNMYSQWTYSSGKSDFDGSYRTSSVYGVGGKFPYTKPLFVVNKFPDRPLNIYISNAGYSGCNGREIFFKFNNDEKIYKTEYVGNDSSSEIWFITSLKNIKDYDFIEKLKNSSSMSVRIKSDCGSEDYKFRLDGSTKALNYVLGENWAKNKKEKDSSLVITEFKKDSLNDFYLKNKKSALVKCKKYLEKYRGKNYDCYMIISAKIIKEYMPEFDTGKIDVKHGDIILVDRKFENRFFLKVKDYNNSGLIEYYARKNEVRFIY